MFSICKCCRKAAIRDYVRRCRRALKRGLRLPAPETIDELREALTRWPQESNWFRPTVETLRQMGLPVGWPECQEVDR